MKGNIAHNEILQFRYMHCFRTAVYVLFVKFAFKVLPIKTLHFRALLSFLFRVFLMKILFEVLHIKTAYVVFVMNIVLRKFLMCAKACCALNFGGFDCA